MSSLDDAPSASGPARSHPLRSDAARNHERVMAAALEVFAERGLQATVPQVAERAGVGKATVYRSYPTKDDLIAAVAQHQFAKLELRTAGALAEPDPYRAFRDYVFELFVTLADDRILADALAEATIVSTGRILELLARLLEAAKPSGQVREDAGELDLRVVLCGAILQLMAVDERDPDVWRRYAELVLNALRPWPAGGSAVHFDRTRESGYRSGANGPMSPSMGAPLRDGEEQNREPDRTPW